MDIIVDGKTRVFALPDTGQTATQLAALSATAINAGEPLHDYLVPTGLEGYEGSTAEIDSTAMSSTFDTKLPGRTSFSGTNLVLKKQDGTDDAFTLLSVKDTPLIIVIMDGVDADQVAAASEDYEAYPVRTGEFNILGRGEANSLLRYRVPTPVSRPRVRGVVPA